MALSDLALLVSAVNLNSVLDASTPGPDRLVASLQALGADGEGCVVPDLPAPGPARDWTAL